MCHSPQLWEDMRNECILEVHVIDCAGFKCAYNVSNNEQVYGVVDLDIILPSIFMRTLRGYMDVEWTYEHPVNSNTDGRMLRWQA